jgi:hypothetical protein
MSLFFKKESVIIIKRSMKESDQSKTGISKAAGQIDWNIECDKDPI